MKWRAGGRWKGGASGMGWGAEMKERGGGRVGDLNSLKLFDISFYPVLFCWELRRGDAARWSYTHVFFLVLHFFSYLLRIFQGNSLLFVVELVRGKGMGKGKAKEKGNLDMIAHNGLGTVVGWYITLLSYAMGERTNIYAGHVLNHHFHYRHRHWLFGSEGWRCGRCGMMFLG